MEVGGRRQSGLRRRSREVGGGRVDGRWGEMSVGGGCGKGAEMVEGVGGEGGRDREGMGTGGTRSGRGERWGASHFGGVGWSVDRHLVGWLVGSWLRRFIYLFVGLLVGWLVALFVGLSVDWLCWMVVVCWLAVVEDFWLWLW